MRLVAAAIYLAYGCLIVYGVYDRADALSDRVVIPALVLFVVLHLAVGWIVGAPALLLPFALVLLSFPAGGLDGDEDAVPVVIPVLMFCVGMVPLIAAGWGAHFLVDRARARI